MGLARPLDSGFASIFFYLNVLFLFEFPDGVHLARSILIQIDSCRFSMP